MDAETLETTSQSNREEFSRKITPLRVWLSDHFDIVLLFLLPIFLIVVNSNWIFTPIGFSPDAWFYNAYFRYFDIYAPAYPSNTHYFVERLTWIVPGFYLYKIFHPLVANYIIHLTVYYIAVFSLFGTISILFNRRAGLICSIVMGCYPWFLRAAGWDHVDGIGIALYLLLIYLLLLALRSPRWKLIIFFAGIIHASLLISHLFWVGFAPIWAIFLLLQSFINGRTTIKKLAWLGLLFIAGNILLTLLVSVYYHQITGKFNFLENSLRFTRILPGDPGTIKDIMDGYGQMTPFWHLLPIVEAIVVIIFLLKAKHQAYRMNFNNVSFTFAIAYACFVYWHYYAIRYLFIFLYSSFLIPVVFMLFGALIANIFDQFSEKQFRSLAVSTSLVLVSPMILCVLIPSMAEMQGNTLLALVAAGMVFLGFFGVNHRAWWFLLVLGLSSLFYIGAADMHVYLADRHKGRDYFILLNQVTHEIDARFPGWQYSDFRLWYKQGHDYDPHLWYDQSEEGSFNYTLSSIYLFPWGSTVDMSPTASFKWPHQTMLKPGNIVLVSSNLNAKEISKETNKALSEQDAILINKSSWHTNLNGRKLTLVFSKLKLLPISIDYMNRFEFDRYIEGSNWYPPEKDDHRTWTWSGPGVNSSVELKLPITKKDIRIDVCAIATSSQETVNSMRMIVNNTEIPISLSGNEKCPILYTATITPIIIAKNTLSTTIEFKVAGTSVPNSYGVHAEKRELGLAFDWLQVQEVK